MDTVRSMYGRKVPANPYEWHSRELFFPAKTLDGAYALRVWRRLRQDGKWEYKKREETGDEWQARQW